MSLENVTAVTTTDLLGKAATLLAQGRRFITITCSDRGDHFDIIYHFDHDYILENLRLTLGKNEPLPSLSAICLCALVVENEIQDLFGIKVQGLAIDYEGKFLLSEGAQVAPFRKPDPTAEAAAPAGTPPAETSSQKEGAS